MTKDPERWTFTCPPRNIPGGHLITARSHLTDRYRAECAQIWLPERTAEAGDYTVETGTLTARSSGRRMPQLLPKTLGRERWFFDMRHHEPENFAHFLNNHVPAFFRALEVSGRNLADACLLLPQKTPGYILDLAALFGLKTLTTRKTFRGAGLSLEATPWTALRAERAAWAGAPLPQRLLTEALARSEAQLPDKIFISRRGTRALENAEEIENWLNSRGFETVFPEDMPVIDQIRLFREAKEIVAIHGAALAPLLYCTEAARPRHVVEIFPVGHMTDVYREMAAAVGCRWLAVQGRIKPSYIKGLYQLDTPFTEYSLDSFEVDPASLEMAFDILTAPAE